MTPLLSAPTFSPATLFQAVVTDLAYIRHNYGNIADERPCKTIENPVIEDLHTTLYHALGISSKLSYLTEKRPFYVTNDGWESRSWTCWQRREKAPL